MNREPIIQVRDLSCSFGTRSRRKVAVDTVSFTIGESEIVSIVGESGSGKTTLARMLLQLQRPSSGTIRLFGQPVTRQRSLYSRIQAVFQDPFSSFNQFYTVGQQLEMCFNLFTRRYSPTQRASMIEEALTYVHLRAGDVCTKFPFELSGGQMQRILLARIFLIKPSILVADEPTSMIDAFLRRSILDLLLDLRSELHMTIIFITHDLTLAQTISDRIFVMYCGRIVEQNTAEAVMSHPSNEYTIRLIEDTPRLDRLWLRPHDSLVTHCNQ